MVDYLLGLCTGFVFLEQKIIFTYNIPLKANLGASED